MEQIHHLTIGDVSQQHGRNRPGAVASICGNDRLTYRELDQRVDQLANVLRGDGYGVGVGDRVVWLAQNCHRALESLLACAKLGAIFAPVNWRNTTEEIVQIIEDLEPKLVLWQDADTGELVANVRERVAGKIQWVCHDSSAEDGYEARISCMSADDPLPEIDPLLPAMILYTAAFEGRPNGAMLTQAGLIQQSIWGMYLQDIDSSTVCLNSGPLFHIAAWSQALPTYLGGGTNVFVRRAEPELICSTIQNERCTRGWLVAQTAARIAELNSEGVYELSSFRTSLKVPGWSSMTSPDLSRQGSYPGGYGQTETTGSTLSAALAGAGGNPMSGRASPLVVARVVDENDIELPDGEVGELILRGPQVHAGYWNRPELNARRFRNGWWHTNDLARREPSGAITFVGAKGRLIKSGSENIYPVEVESCLEKHSAIKDVAVIGIPDDHWNQSVKAVVVLKAGVRVSAEELVEHCRANLASYKKPRYIEFTSELPRVNGVKDYAQVDRQFGGGGYPGAQ